MEQKTKVLIGVITDQEIGCRNQEDYIEELAENIAERDDIIRGLRQEKITSSEAYHEAMVSKDVLIERLRETVKEYDEEIDKYRADINDRYSKLSKAVLDQGYCRNHLGRRTLLPTDYQLIDGCKRAIKEQDKHKAKSSKLTAEKREFMRIVKKRMTTYPMTSPNPRLLEEIEMEYKDWLRAQRKSGK